MFNKIGKTYFVISNFVEPNDKQHNIIAITPWEGEAEWTNLLDWFRNLRMVLKQERKEFCHRETCSNEPAANAPRAD